MNKLNDLDFDRLGIDLLISGIENIVKAEFKDVPGVVELFNFGRLLGRIDILQKMQAISDACTEDAKEYVKSMNELKEQLKRKIDGEEE